VKDKEECLITREKRLYVLLPSVVRNWIGQCCRKIVWREDAVKGTKKYYREKRRSQKMDEIIDPVKDQDKLKLRELNKDSYKDLILSIEGDGKAGRVAFQLVKGSKTTDLKDGDAALAWSRLANQY
jgi:hypothetical protein